MSLGSVLKEKEDEGSIDCEVFNEIWSKHLKNWVILVEDLTRILDKSLIKKVYEYIRQGILIQDYVCVEWVCERGWFTCLKKKLGITINWRHRYYIKGKELIIELKKLLCEYS